MSFFLLSSSAVPASIAGSANIAEEDDTLIATDALQITSALDVIEQDDTLAATGVFLIRGGNPIDLILNPSDLGNDSWIKSYCSIGEDATADPDGGMAADKIIESSDSVVRWHRVIGSDHLMDSDEIITAAGRFKVGGRDSVLFSISDTGSFHQYSIVLNLATLIVDQTNWSGSVTDRSYNVRDLGDGWAEVRISARLNNGQCLVHAHVSPVTGGTWIYIGDGISGIYTYKINLYIESSIVEEDDALAAAGTLPISGLSNISEAYDTLAAAGALPISGLSNIPEVYDTLAASGTVSISGALNITEENDSASSPGALDITGDLSAQGADDSLTASGLLSISGAVSVIEEDDVSSASGSISLSGIVSVSEEGDALTASGLLPITGISSITEINDALLAMGENEHHSPVISDSIDFNRMVSDEIRFIYMINDSLEAA